MPFRLSREMMTSGTQFDWFFLLSMELLLPQEYFASFKTFYSHNLKANYDEIKWSRTHHYIGLEWKWFHYKKDSIQWMVSEVVNDRYGYRISWVVLFCWILKGLDPEGYSSWHFAIFDAPCTVWIFFFGLSSIAHSCWQLEQVAVYLIVKLKRDLYLVDLVPLCAPYIYV